jgi:hypothetical protein
MTMHTETTLHHMFNAGRLYSADAINALVAEIHADNVAAGWWTDLKTGESLIGKRNVPEMLCLIHSEISEAFDGMSQRLPDDKLTHRMMFEVELADAVIRIFDLAGGTQVNLGWAVTEAHHNAPASIYGPNPLVRLMTVHSHISAAMEAYRKADKTRFDEALGEAVWAICAIAMGQGLDLSGAIQEKRAYNRHRADHKRENRLAHGGKAF